MAQQDGDCGGGEDWLQIRDMRPHEICQAVDIWKEQGLEQGMNNVSIFYQVDPEGFFVAVDTRTGEVVATCACMRQRPSLYFVGMYAVRKKLQGRGIGVRLWKTMTQRFGDCNAGLNAVPKHLSTYRDRAGFGFVEPWNTLVYNTVTVTPEKLPAQTDDLRVVPIDEELLPQVIAYDALVHCFDREATVTLTVTDTDGFSKAVLRRQDDGEDLVCGFGKISSNILGGAMVGPLYAKDPEAAGALLRCLVESNPLSRVSLTMMVVDCNPDACSLAEDLGLKHYMKVPRCYRKESVPARLEQVYAQHDLNFCTF
ncbi:conserved hypothetical protein [Ixodes scapularis]|uniref:N-acetyltransferase domain-containing protein n=1 Tax=Ixodes scapularis TaxID=6945 RepID=B7P1E8_IXOSC|nr:conserved hypothetical protein [Ixodes scapularis]|eukprot:XP_002433356.1 conserved hypothetical protein [Ixodes scapularis]